MSYDVFVNRQPAVSHTNRSPTFRSRDGNASITYAPSVSRPPCQTLEELTDALVEDMEAATRSTVPECTTCELTLALSALVPLHRPIIGPYAEGGERDLPAEYKTNWIASGKDGKKQHPQASAYAVVFANEQEERHIVQRAASRGILTAIEKADGFKYSFNNAWTAKDNDGMRFSYICQDSTQNKDRHANGFPKTLKHLKGAGERGPRKETFDCKGSVSVKYSLQKRTLEVFYRHYAIHPKVKERMPYPRGGTRRLKRPNHSEPIPGLSLDEDTDHDTNQNVGQGDEETGGLFGKLQKMKFAYIDSPAPSKPQVMAEANTSQASNIGRPLKRKREDETVYSQSSEKVLSLAEILKQSQTAKARPKSKQTNTLRPNDNGRPSPMEYSLPSWQIPPPAPPPPVNKQPQPATQPSNLPLSYQQPYQSQTPQQLHPAHQPPWPSRPASQQAPHQQRPPPRPPPARPRQDPRPVHRHEADPRLLHNHLHPIRPTRGQRSHEDKLHQLPLRQEKCDETRPICTPCARAGSYDCQYEAPYAYPAPPQPHASSSVPASVAMMQARASGGIDMRAPQEMVQRDRPASPDPRFPKR